MESISVVIPLYNKEKHIERTLRSVLAQTVLPYEIIVVDDGSKDNGPAVVEGIKDSRIKLIRQANSGVCVARNRGIHEALGELIAFLDADDEWKPDYLETILKLYAKFPHAGAYATAYETMDKAGLHAVAYRGIPASPWEGIIPDFFDSMLGQPPVWTSAAVIKKPVFEEAGYFKVGETIAEDVDMWCRVALKFPIAFSTKACAVYRQDAENRAYVNGKKQKKPLGYIVTLEAAAKDLSLPEATRKNIAALRETVEIGYATSLIFSGNAGEARKVLSDFDFKYYTRQKDFWYRLSFLPVKLLYFLLDLKSKLRK